MESTGARLGEEIPSLSNADLSGANLSGANLSGADLSGANLSEANLSGANLSAGQPQRGRPQRGQPQRGQPQRGQPQRGRPQSVRISDSASCWATVFANVDLSEVKGLDSVRHAGPSTIGIDTLFRSKGKIPEAFLRGCGVPEMPDRDPCL